MSKASFIIMTSFGKNMPESERVVMRMPRYLWNSDLVAEIAWPIVANHIDCMINSFISNKF